MINDILHLPTASVFGTSPDPRRPQLTCSSDLTADDISDVITQGTQENGVVPESRPPVAMSPPQLNTHGYQISLTPGVPNEQGQGLRHELILTENSNPQTAARRSQRVAKRPRVVHSKTEGIIIPTQKAKSITTSSPLSNKSALQQLKSKLNSKSKHQSSPEGQRHIPDQQLVPEMAEEVNSENNASYDVNEQKIVHATIQAFQTGSLTPLIKEELRCTIQSRRLAQGKGELKVEFKTPPKRKEVSLVFG